MKKFLFAVMALIMTLSVSAQNTAKSQVKTSTDAQKHECVYTPLTRAMMRVDRIASVAKDLSVSERKELVSFFTKHIEKIDALRADNKEIDKETLRKECNAELRKVLGDERYIKYLEDKQAKKINAKMARKAKKRMAHK